MIRIDGHDYYGLEVAEVRVPGGGFRPSGSTGLITADRKRFSSQAIYYDRARRGQSWIILDLVIWDENGDPGNPGNRPRLRPARFIPHGSSGLVTADGKTLWSRGIKPE